MNIVRTVAIALFIAAIGASNVAAQQAVLRGNVLDEHSTAPVTAAAVLLVDTAGRRVVSTGTDKDGQFQLNVPTGLFRLRIERLGYFPRETGLMRVEEGGQGAFEFHLSPRPVLLDSMLVTGRAETRPLRAGEQLIHGRLVDDDTRQPIPLGNIELFENKRKIGTTITDKFGLFRLVTPRPGKYRLGANHLGYKPAESPELTMTLGDTIRLDFSLSTSAVLMSPLVVTGSARDWNKRHDVAFMNEMIGRMNRYARSGFGQFLTRDSLERLQKDGHTTKSVITFRKTRGFSSAAQSGCFPRYSLFVNGDPIPLDGVPDTLQFIEDQYGLPMLEAIEYYQAPEIPAVFAIGFRPAGQYRPPCEVIAVWTRRSRLE